MTARKWVWLAILLQLGLLAAMALEREWIQRQGRRVRLLTAPLDPRDLFRGDYVRLNYEISDIALEQVVTDVEDLRAAGNRQVYLKLDFDESGFGIPSTLTTDRPETGVYIRGFVDPANRWRRRGVAVRYGIEAYFMQQGRALELERSTAQDGVRIPLIVTAGLSRSGKAVIVGYDKAPLGIGTIVPRIDRRAGVDTVVSRITLRLLNASSDPVVVVDPRRYVRMELFDASLSEVNRPDRSAPVTDADVLLLAPGDSSTIDIDFADNRWKVLRHGQVVSLHHLGANVAARFVYDPPSVDRCRHLAAAKQISHVRLISQRVFVNGRVD